MHKKNVKFGALLSLVLPLLLGSCTKSGPSGVSVFVKLRGTVDQRELIVDFDKQPGFYGKTVAIEGLDPSEKDIFIDFVKTQKASNSKSIILVSSPKRLKHADSKWCFYLFVSPARNSTLEIQSLNGGNDMEVDSDASLHESLIISLEDKIYRFTVEEGEDGQMLFEKETFDFVRPKNSSADRVSGSEVRDERGDSE